MRGTRISLRRYNSIDVKCLILYVSRNESELRKKISSLGVSIQFFRAIPIFFNRHKRVFSLSDRYKIFTSNWLSIEICENVVLSKVDITMTTIDKKL